MIITSLSIDNCGRVTEYVFVRRQKSDSGNNSSANSDMAILNDIISFLAGLHGQQGRIIDNHLITTFSVTFQTCDISRVFNNDFLVVNLVLDTRDTEIDRVLLDCRGTFLQL